MVGEEAHSAGNHYHRQRAIGEKSLGEGEKEVSHHGGQHVEESPAEGRARGGGSSRLPEESRWERRLPPLQRAGARPRSGRPRPPLPLAPPGNFQYDSTSPGPAVGEEREEEQPPSGRDPSSQQVRFPHSHLTGLCRRRQSGASTRPIYTMLSGVILTGDVVRLLYLHPEFYTCPFCYAGESAAMMQGSGRYKLYSSLINHRLSERQTTR